MAFDTDAGGVCLRTVGTADADWCCAGVDSVVGIDVTAGDSGFHFSKLPFFDICWTKIISLSAPENPRKLDTRHAFRFDHPVSSVVPNRLGCKNDLHCRAVLLHPSEDIMSEVTSQWSHSVQTFHPQIPAGRDIALFTVGRGRVTADADRLAAIIVIWPCSPLKIGL